MSNIQHNAPAKKLHQTFTLIYPCLLSIGGHFEILILCHRKLENWQNPSYLLIIVMEEVKDTHGKESRIKKNIGT